MNLTDEERKIKDVEFALTGEFYIGQQVRHVRERTDYRSGFVVRLKRGFI